MVLVRGGIIVKPHVQRCANDVVAQFGASLSPGTYPGHSPPEGPTQALDLFTANSPAGWALQAEICRWLIEHAKEYGIRYLIRWNPNGRDLIWNIERASEGWRAKATNDHSNHVHVTFYASAPDSAKPAIPTPTLEEMTHMDFMYQFNGEDYFYSPTAFYWGKLPFGEFLDKVSKAKVVHAFGPVGKEFHDAVKVLADNAGFRGIK